MPATPTSSARHSTAHAESELCRAQPRHVVVRTASSERTHLPLSLRSRWLMDRAEATTRSLSSPRAKTLPLSC